MRPGADDEYFKWGKHADNTVDLQEFMIMPTGEGCLEGRCPCVEDFFPPQHPPLGRGWSWRVGGGEGLGLGVLLL